MAQAKEYENDKNNHMSEIFSGKAEKLAQGGVEKVNGKDQDLKVFGTNLPSLVIIGWVIILFSVFYLSALIIYASTFFTISLTK